MKNFLNVFNQPKKEKSKTRFEEAFEKKIEHQLNRITLTEPDKHDMPSVLSRSPRVDDEDQPVVKLLNPLRGHPNLPEAE